MGIKAIVTDLDRTLLHTDKSISDYTLEVFNRCRERGILIMAASARPLRDIVIFRDQLPFDAITATNGAVISLSDGIHEIGIPLKDGEIILERLLCHPEVFLSIETSKGLYSNRDIPIWKPVVYDKFPALPDGIILYKILASSELPSLYENVEGNLTESTYYTVANGNLIQIMSREATKWNGICRMLSHFGISPADAIYFGDDNDDLEALLLCGTGVAVANSIDAVKEKATLMTESNDEDGVAKFIERTVLQND